MKGVLTSALSLLATACIGGGDGSGTFDIDGDGFFDQEDCNDNDASIHPDAQELCDAEGAIDEDCDGLIDDEDLLPGNTTTFYRDEDRDGYGDRENKDETCVISDGFAVEAGDCDDEERLSNPGRDEVCDDERRDDDCDGLVNDEDDSVREQLAWFADNDGDGFGDPAGLELSCERPNDTVENADDCDDTDDDVNPDAKEACDPDNKDEDCDGLADDDDDSQTGKISFYPDEDQDGYGDDSRGSTASCDAAPMQIANDNDCDDAASDINPGEDEVCGDGVDNDCDNDASQCAVGADAEDDDADWTIVGTGTDSLLGWTLATTEHGAWLGRPQFTGGGGQGGAVYISGSAKSDGSPEDLGLPMVSAAETGEFGFALAAGPDITGDGIDDLVVGAPFSDLAYTDAGTAYIFAGPFSGESSESDAFAARTGPSTSDYVGAASAIGDWDGDGWADLLMAAGTAYTVEIELGPIQSGTAGVSTYTDTTLASSSSNGPDVKLATGDVDGDGRVEAAIGEWATAGVRIYEGGGSGTLDSGDQLTYLDSSSSTDGYGFEVRIGPDLNGDGYGDVVASAPFASSETGLVRVVFGPLTDSEYEYSEVDATFTSDVASEYFGYGIAIGRDMDGDDLAELVIGAPGNSDNDDYAGWIYVYGGGVRAGDFDNGDATSNIEGTYSFGQIGFSVGAPDLDSDGLSDVVVAAINQDADQNAGGAFVFYGGTI